MQRELLILADQWLLIALRRMLLLARGVETPESAGFDPPTPPANENGSQRHSGAARL
jgi:hypothetical protein